MALPPQIYSCILLRTFPSSSLSSAVNAPTSPRSPPPFLPAFFVACEHYDAGNYQQALSSFQECVTSLTSPSHHSKKEKNEEKERTEIPPPVGRMPNIIEDTEHSSPLVTISFPSNAENGESEENIIEPPTRPHSASHTPGDYSHMAQSLRTLLSLYHNAVACTLLLLHQLSPAKHSMYAATDCDETISTYYFNLGCIHDERKEYDLSIKSYKLAVKRGANEIYVHSNLGVAYKAKKEYNKSLASLITAVEISATNPICLYNLATTCLCKDKYKEAINYLKKAIEHEKNAATHIHLISKNTFATYYSQLAFAYTSMQEYISGIYYSSLAITLDPTIPHPYRNRALCFVGEKCYLIALGDAMRAQELFDKGEWPKKEKHSEQLGIWMKEWKTLAVTEGEDKETISLLHSVNALSSSSSIPLAQHKQLLEAQITQLNTNHQAIINDMKATHLLEKQALLTTIHNNKLTTPSLTLKPSDPNKKEVLLCVVCLDEARSILFEPCKHLSCCDLCASRVRTCPICKEKIKKRRGPVYF